MFDDLKLKKKKKDMQLIVLLYWIVETLATLRLSTAGDYLCQNKMIKVITNDKTHANKSIKDD